MHTTWWCIDSCFAPSSSIATRVPIGMHLSVIAVSYVLTHLISTNRKHKHTCIMRPFFDGNIEHMMTGIALHAHVCISILMMKAYLS